uniref:Protein kinase domain-containing protein n=1 Tax=Ascaris lumbricoides TaxID=6252 RepID=A0A0M3HRD1_ASCLU
MLAVRLVRKGYIGPPLDSPSEEKRKIPLAKKNVWNLGSIILALAAEGGRKSEEFQQSFAVCGNFIKEAKSPKPLMIR